MMTRCPVSMTVAKVTNDTEDLVLVTFHNPGPSTQYALTPKQARDLASLLAEADT